ncbi:thioesterase II family protein [Clostridium sp. UBA6640]|uniref:thioesterase II family protein n=1 Tax=Clostridium sp. UBA6640 TaxID=1946370 RepID=UPI0025BF1612|nr:thioesterase domain-containing protein [Clostridium sp. UBA6640]
MKRIKLFCIPYAGGSGLIFYKWKKYLNSYIQLEPIELKGRGRRFGEKFYETLEEAVNDIFEIIKVQIENEEYAIYGHSMGSLLAYELYYKINSENLRMPTHMLFSGHEAPNIERQERNIHLLPDDEFIKEVIDLGGTPEDISNNKELLDLFIPILRSDFRILDNYKYKEGRNKIHCDISIFNGKQDDISLEAILKWKEHGDKSFNVYNFEGNHFFINDNVENITKIINETLIR